MGLKFSDALRLSWSNIAEHKKRSVAIVLTISILFGVIMGFNFMLEGLRETILGAALQANDGKVYLDVGYQELAGFGPGRVEKVDSEAKLDEFIKEGVTRYHGKIIGEKLNYQFNNIFETITPAVAESISGEIDLSSVPEDKVAVLMPAETSQYAAVDRGDYYIVGTYPATQQGSPTLPGLNPVNLLLSMVYGSGINARPLIIDNDSEAVHNYFLKLAQQKVYSGSPYASAEEYLETVVPQTRYIVEFPNYESAVNYYYDIYAEKSIPKNVEIGDDCVIMPYASVMSGTRMGRGNRVFQNAVLGAEPQDFKYKGDDTLLVIGDNNVIRENVVINRATFADGKTEIGNGNFLHEGVHISHDTKIGSHCVLGYGSKLSGNCLLEDCVIFGGNILMSQGCRVGCWSMVQTGCRFRKDIPPYIVAAKEPTTYYGINAHILEHEGYSEKVVKHMSHAYRIIYQGNTSIFDALLMIKDQVPMSEEIQHIIDFVNASKLGIIK